jgi:nucleoside-diphosphate-sugar epimerase
MLIKFGNKTNFIGVTFFQIYMSDLLNSLKNSNVLITGGCGFIGSEVTKQLSELGSNVTVFDNLSSGKEEYIANLPNVTLVKGDQTNESQVNAAMKDQEYIINLTALPFIPDSYYYPKEFFDVNVSATITLLLAAKNQKNLKRFIHISSSEIYGSTRISPMTENHPTIPQSTYAVSKLAGERVAHTMHKEHEIPVVVIRPFNSYGPNITQPYIIPEIIQQLQKSNVLRLGNVNSKRDFTYVSDTARGMILSLITDGIIGETINIGSEKSVSIKDLAKIISKIMNKDIKIEIDSSRLRPNDVENLVCDYSKASRLLGWKPEISIETGLKNTIEWLDANDLNFKSPFKNWPSQYRDNLTKHD